MSPIVGLLLISAVSVAACYFIAKRRGAKVVFWVTLAALIGPLAIPFVFFSKPRAL